MCTPLFVSSAGRTKEGRGWVRHRWLPNPYAMSIGAGCCIAFLSLYIANDDGSVPGTSPKYSASALIDGVFFQDGPVAGRLPRLFATIPPTAETRRIESAVTASLAAHPRQGQAIEDDLQSGDPVKVERGLHLAGDVVLRAADDVLGRQNVDAVIEKASAQGLLPKTLRQCASSSPTTLACTAPSGRAEVNTLVVLSSVGAGNTVAVSASNVYTTSSTATTFTTAEASGQILDSNTALQTNSIASANVNVTSNIATNASTAFNTNSVVSADSNVSSDYNAATSSNANYNVASNISVAVTGGVGVIAVAVVIVVFVFGVLLFVGDANPSSNSLIESMISSISSALHRGK